MFQLVAGITPVITANRLPVKYVYQRIVGSIIFFLLTVGFDRSSSGAGVGGRASSLCSKHLLE